MADCVVEYVKDNSANESRDSILITAGSDPPIQ